MVALPQRYLQKNTYHEKLTTCINEYGKIGMEYYFYIELNMF
ncbi:MAG: hypothetical protein DDT31_00700 [Syntrophomonadaceae bacterium]|nr:hypothetical protein [Bacillota bacterium]